MSEQKKKKTLKVGDKEIRLNHGNFNNLIIELLVKIVNLLEDLRKSEDTK